MKTDALTGQIELKDLEEENAALRGQLDRLAQHRAEAEEDTDAKRIGNVLGLNAGPEPDPEGEAEAEYSVKYDELRDAIGGNVLNAHLIVPFTHTHRVRRVIEAIAAYRHFEAENKALEAIMTEWSCTGYSK